ncbi:MAG: HAD family hydrolase [Bdellovibrionota bacterium]
MHKAIFLDRDGTIIVDKVYLNDPDQIEFLPNAIEGLKLFRDMGFKIYVVTNQSGVPRGKVTIPNLNEIHRRMSVECEKHGITIERFYYAPYMTDSNHHMRKPNPGMLEEAHKDFGVDFKKSWIIGDKMLDVEAGHRAGTRSILLKTSGEDPEKSDFAPPEYIANDLLDSAQFIKASVL